MGGGGIFGVNAEVHHSTITANQADATRRGAGIDITSNAGASLTLRNSIVAGNMTVGGNSRPDIDPSSATLAVNYTFIGDVDGVLISGSGNILGDSQGGGAIDPQLAPLANNGGPTPTHALLPSSFAIDEGDRFAVAGEDEVALYDQRGAGFTRVYDGRIDMGSFEAQPNTIPDGDFNDDGIYDCADIDALVAEIAAGGNIASFDMTSDGVVDLADRDAWLAEAGDANLPSGNPYLVGDANLDGNVDGQDFLAWNLSKFSNVAAWCQGDFNADGNVDGQDFLLWNTNKFTSADAIDNGTDSHNEAKLIAEPNEPAIFDQPGDPRLIDHEQIHRATFATEEGPIRAVRRHGESTKSTQTDLVDFDQPF